MKKWKIYFLPTLIILTAFALPYYADSTEEDPLGEQKEKYVLSLRTIRKYKYGRSELRRRLKETRRQYYVQGYRGRALSNLVRGAKAGILTAFKTFKLKVILKRKNFLIFQTKDQRAILKYKIKRNVLYIKNKSGEYIKFGKFKRRKRILVLLDGSILNKY